MGLQNKLDIVIIDECEPCPYLEGEVARMPLRMPLQPLTPESMDHLLETGNRRTGEFVYRTQCPDCRECVPVRIDCNCFPFNSNWRRVLNRGNRLFRQEIGPMHCTKDRVDLFNKHRSMRRLAKHDAAIDADEYQWGFIKSCFQSFEIAYYDESNQLSCLAVCDQGKSSLSAVYTFYDPELKSASLGTYSILKQIEFCRTHNLRYLYLGFLVSGSVHMRYKKRFLPQQVLRGGEWIQVNDETDF
ncbi:MAG: arginyltransferase [Pirellulaceae bacterium]